MVQSAISRSSKQVTRSPPPWRVTLARTVHDLRNNTLVHDSGLTQTYSLGVLFYADLPYRSSQE